MSIRPVDIQMSIQRSNEYTKEANLQNQKVDIFQFANTREFQHAVDNAQRQVVSTGHIFHKRVDKKSKEKHHLKQNKPSSKESNMNTDGMSGGIAIGEDDKGINIDIKI